MQQIDRGSRYVPMGEYEGVERKGLSRGVRRVWEECTEAQI